MSSNGDLTEKTVKQFYNSKDWKELSAYKRKVNPVCERCERLGWVTIANQVHHLVPVRTDWSLRFDLGNLQSLCRRCHRTVENQEGTGRN